MKRLIIATFLVLAFLAWRFWPTAGSNPEPSAASRGPQYAEISSPQPKTQNSTPKIPSEQSTLAYALNSATGDIRADLRIVDELVATFRSNFPRDGNPVGSNADITAVLAGKNRLQLAVLPPGHSAINREGELCDRWGTPFFFHAESGTRMEIRSGGPDKKLFTEDDTVFAP
ncbi:MAG: hypothetical protein EXS43_12005 [Opitutus sp.]|nr:hypothetical protein [Opitutus sp.]